MAGTGSVGRKPVEELVYELRELIKLSVIEFDMFGVTRK